MRQIGAGGGKLSSECIVIVDTDVTGTGVKREVAGAQVEVSTEKVLIHPGAGSGSGGGTGPAVPWGWIADAQTRAMG